MTEPIDLNDYRAANAGATERRASEPRAGGARILLFTGVRYERMDEAPMEARRGHA